MDKRIFSTFV